MSTDNDFSELLAEKDRLLMAAWTLPNEGPLTETERREAMTNFTKYCRLHDIKPAQVGRQLGKPKATTITELQNGVFRASADDHIRKLNLWIEQHARRRAAALTDKFVTTTKVATSILAVARLVSENQTMGMVLGPSGIGKSRCAEALNAKYVGSVYVCVMDGYEYPRGLTRALAAALKVRDPRKGDRPGYQRTQIERVVDALRNSGRLLLIDEAHALHDRSIQLLRSIHDATGAPILLFATSDLHERILKNADPDHGQLYSRIDIVHHLTQGYDIYAGGKALHTLQDIKDMYNDPPIRLSTDAASHLQEVANQLGYGSLRRCKCLLRNAVRRARKRQHLGDTEKVTVTAEDLEWVESRLRQETSEQNVVKDRRRVAADAISG